MKVQAAFYDATEDLHLIPIAWNASQIVTNGKTKTLIWQNEAYKNGVATSVGWIVVVQKVLFEDGSTWEYSSSTPSCYGEYWADKRHPRLTVLPEREKFQNTNSKATEAAGN